MLSRLSPYLSLLALACALGMPFAARSCQSPAPPPPAPQPQPQPEPPKPDPKPEPKPDTAKAIARIQFGNAGCTCTVIGPRRDDGSWWCLTASHCVKGVGQRGTMRMLDG